MDAQGWETPSEIAKQNANLQRLSQAVDQVYHRPGLMMWRSFLQGFMTALGAWVGAIAIVAISGFVVHRLNLFPKLSDAFQTFLVDSQTKAIQKTITQQ